MIDKLTTIAENVQKVYDAGRANGTGTTTMSITPKSDTATTANVTVIGKNLLNLEPACSTALVSNGNGSYTFTYDTVTKNRWSRKTALFIPANTSFVIKVNITETTQTTGTWLYLRFYCADGTYLYRSCGTSLFKFTHTADITGFDMYLQSTEALGTYTKFDSMQIEIGTAATAYEPYTEYTNQTATVGETITLPVPAQNMTVFTTTDGVTLDVTYPKEA